LSKYLSALHKTISNPNNIPIFEIKEENEEEVDIVSTFFLEKYYQRKFLFFGVYRTHLVLLFHTHTH
jgi:hypothetical protein